ncbi:MAG: 6-pyruvoyl-tetrahydropterin synthase-related protein [Pyrinomonadaceae bacterium]
MTDPVNRIHRACDRVWFCFFIVFSACILTIILPVVLHGLHGSGDTFVYLNFAAELREAWENGRIIPSWGSGGLGFGSVGIRFYPPLSFYTLAALHALFGNWYLALLGSNLLWMLVGCWGVFLFARNWTTPLQAVAAACLYSFAPFHLAEIYQFSLIGEFVASAVLPYCFLYAARICEIREWRDVPKFGVAIGLLILAHIPSTIIGSITLVIFISMMARRPLFLRGVRLVTSMLIALSLTAFYWVKVVTEVDWVAHSWCQYSSNFTNYAVWLFPMWPFPDGSNDIYVPIFRNLDAMVLLTTLLLLPGLSAVLLRTRSGSIADDIRRLIRALISAALFGVFMLSAASSSLWAGIPLLQKLQFPWRWLSVLSMIASVVFTIGIFSFTKGKRILVIFAVALIGTVGVYNVRQNFLRSNIITSLEIQQMLDVKNAPAGTTLEAWWPIWAKADALKNSERVSGVGDVKVSKWDAEDRRFTIIAGQAGDFRVATFYYPYWKAEINGTPREVDHDDTGSIKLRLDAGTSEVRLFFEEPLRTRIAGWISILAIVVPIIFTISLNLRSSNRSRAENLRLNTQ